MNETTTAVKVTLSCDCAACADLPDASADHRVLDGIPAGMSPTTFRAQIAHTYVQYASGASPLARIMCSRYDVKAV